MIHRTTSSTSKTKQTIPLYHCCITALYVLWCILCIYTTIILLFCNIYRANYHHKQRHDLQRYNRKQTTVSQTLQQIIHHDSIDTMKYERRPCHHSLPLCTNILQHTTSIRHYSYHSSCQPQSSCHIHCHHMPDHEYTNDSSSSCPYSYHTDCTIRSRHITQM